MMFNNNNWKLSVTDINLYENTVSLDGQSYPLSLAIKTLIPGYLSVRYKKLLSLFNRLRKQAHNKLSL